MVIYTLQFTIKHTVTRGKYYAGSTQLQLIKTTALFTHIYDKNTEMIIKWSNHNMVTRKLIHVLDS